MSGRRKATLFLGTEADEGLAQFSPDGRFVIYVSDENGPAEIFMRTFPDGAGKWQISRGGGTTPRWSRDGKEIFYQSNGTSISAVRVTMAPTVTIGEPAVAYLGGDGGAYDVTPDGGLLIAQTNSQNSVNPIHVTVNWQAGLKK
jgi:Tol biopolymer transport system component